jgi:cholesterol transport system auxiliary component
MTQARALRSLALALALAGCNLPGSGDPAQLYVLTPKNTFQADLPKVEWQLVVEPPVAAAGYNTNRIALQRTPLSLDYYARASWTDSAPAMVQTLIIESFENTGKIVGVSRESVQLRPDYILKTELREFQAEYFPDAGAPLVRVRVTALIVRMPERTIIASQSFERTERAAGGDMRQIAEAFDEALGGVLKRLIDWTLRAAPPERPRGAPPRG